MGIFWDEFFGRIFLEDFFGGFLGGILTLLKSAKLEGIDFFVKILVFVKILSQCTRKKVRKEGRKEGRKKNFRSLEVRLQVCKYIALKNNTYYDKNTTFIFTLELLRLFRLALAIQ